MLIKSFLNLLAFSSCKASQNIEFFFNTSYRGIPGGGSYLYVFFLFVYRGNGRVSGRAFNLAYKRKFTVYKKRNSLKQKMRRFLRGSLLLYG